MAKRTLMSAWVGLALAALHPLGVAAQTAGTPAPFPQSPIENAALVERSLTFIGFSGNESVCAWRQTTRRLAGTRWVDVASTILLLRMADSHILAVYRETAPHRITRTGHFVHADRAALLWHAPEYTQALPAADWTHVRRRAQFTTLRADFKDAMVRLEPDPDSHLHVTAKNEVLHVVGAAGEPLGFQVIGRLHDGDLLPLGRFRLPPYAHAVPQAEVTLYYSHSGHSMAVLTHFVGPHVPLDAAMRISVVQHQQSPLGTWHMGTQARAWQDGKSVKDLFEQMHPDGKKDWEENVGTLF